MSTSSNSSLPNPSMSATTCNQIIDDPTAWTADTMRGLETEWLIHLTDDQLSDIRQYIISQQTSSSISHSSSPNNTHHPLPHWQSLFTDLTHELQYGRGFVMLRGLDVNEYSEEELQNIFSMLGRQFGTLQSQNSKGALLGHVRNQGYTNYDNSDVRGYQTNAKLTFHTDVADAVGLLCIKPARTGGESLLASSTAIHNKMLEECPLLLGTLYSTFLWDKKGEEAAGESPYWSSPIYHFYKGFLNCRPGVISYAYSAQAKTNVPLSDAQKVALDRLLQYAESDEFKLSIPFQPGDIQLVSNATILHSRESFTDHDDSSQRRHLLRVWFNFLDGRPIKDGVFPYRTGVPTRVSVGKAHR